MADELIEFDGFYDEDQQELLWWFTLIFGILSLISQFMIFCTYVCLKLESPISASVEKDKARTIHVFIACISFYDFMRIVGTLINAEYPYSDNKDKCITEVIFITFGALSTFMLIAVISIIMVISVLMQNKAELIVDEVHKKRAIILAIITILALLGALVPVEYWCSDYHEELRGVTIVPLLIIYCIIITSYLLICIYFCCKKSMKVNNHFYRDIKLFPGILLCCWLFSVYRRIYNVVNDKEPTFAISCIAVVTVSIYGFCNFIAYWITMSYQYKKKESQGSTINVTDNEMQAISKHHESDSNN